jgi:hypothetical protein
MRLFFNLLVALGIIVALVQCEQKSPNISKRNVASQSDFESKSKVFNLNKYEMVKRKQVPFKWGKRTLARESKPTELAEKCSQLIHMINTNSVDIHKFQLSQLKDILNKCFKFIDETSVLHEQDESESLENDFIRSESRELFGNDNSHDHQVDEYESTEYSGENVSNNEKRRKRKRGISELYKKRNNIPFRWG